MSRSRLQRCLILTGKFHRLVRAGRGGGGGGLGGGGLNSYGPSSNYLRISPFSLTVSLSTQVYKFMSPAELLGKHPIQKGEGWFNIAGRFMLRKPELRAWNCERTYWRTLSIYNYLVVTNTNLNVIMKVLSPNESSLSPFFISLAVLDNIVLRKLVHSRHYHSLVSKFYFKNFVTSY